MRSITRALAGFSLLLSAQAFAVPVTWTDWTYADPYTAIGNMAGIDVRIRALTNPMNGPTQTACGTNWWTEPNASDLPYTGGTVSNAPTACEQVGLNYPGVFEVYFSRPATNLYMALLSVGQAGVQVNYIFDRPFTVDSEGQGFWGNGSYSTPAANVLYANEFHGVLSFSGSLTYLRFQTSAAEYWHAFTFGVAQDVRVPFVGSTLPLMGLGLMLMGIARRRRPG